MDTSASPATNDLTHEQMERVRQTELLISNLLRGGVVLSVILIVIGTAVTFVHHPGYLSSADALNSLIDGKNGYPTSISGVIRGLASFEGRAIVMLGLLTLIATPVMRVAVSILAFVHLRDRAFVAITSAVLILLLLALALGKAGG